MCGEPEPEIGEMGVDGIGVDAFVGLLGGGNRRGVKRKQDLAE